MRFTDEQINQANSIDLAEHLRCRGEKIVRSGHEYKLIYHDESGTHDSITISGSDWFDHKNQTGGGAVKFMEKFYGLSFREAVQELLGESCVQVKEKPHREKKEFILPEKNENMHRVFAYLIKQRCIASEIIACFARKNTLFEDKEHHNCVFVGVDGNGVPRQAHKRSTSTFGKSFRMTCEGSDTRYSFSHFGNSGRIYVFEAPIDMLSYITLHPENWENHSYIAMNGIYESSVLTALAEHSHLKSVIFCTDNDVGGNDAASRISEILRQRGYDRIYRILPKNKDWNEDLKEQNGMDFTPAVNDVNDVKFRQSVDALKYYRNSMYKFKENISQTYRNKQFGFLAELALAGSAFFIDKNNEEAVFEKQKKRLAHSFFMFRNADLTQEFEKTMKLISMNAGTAEQLNQTANQLFFLAGCAAREVQNVELAMDRNNNPEHNFCADNDICIQYQQLFP